MNPLVVQGAAQLLLGKYKSEKGLFMKNMLTMAATGLVIFAGLGWYLDWYKVARTTTPDGKQQITIDVNTKRIESDFDKGRSKVTGYLQSNGVPIGNAAPQGQYPYQAAPVGQQPYPNNGYIPQQTAYPPPGYQQQPQNWAPAAPVNRPNNGGYVFPGTPQGYVPPPPQQQIPGRPF